MQRLKPKVGPAFHVLIATSSPTFWLSMPTVTQLSAPNSGKKPRNEGIALHDEPPNWLL